MPANSDYEQFNYNAILGICHMIFLIHVIRAASTNGNAFHLAAMCYLTPTLQSGLLNLPDSTEHHTMPYVHNITRKKHEGKDKSDVSGNSSHREHWSSRLFHQEAIALMGLLSLVQPGGHCTHGINKAYWTWSALQSSPLVV
jgi:hypothetical protein